jgi:hypothetical protein
MPYLIIVAFLFFTKNKKWSEIFLMYAPITDAFYHFLPGKDLFYDIPKFLAFVIVYFSFYYKNRVEISRKCRGSGFVKITFLFILSLFISLTQSTDVLYSFTWLTNYSLAISSIVIYFYFFSIQKSLVYTIEKFFKICFIAASLWLIYISACSFFEYGRFYEDYAVTSFIYFGHTNFFQLFPWVYLLMVFPYFLISQKNLLFYTAVWIASLLIIIIIAKRTYIYITLIGIALTLVPFYVTRRKLSSLFFFSIIMIITFYSSRGLINKYFFQARAVSLEHSYFEEGRFYELSSYKIEIIDREPITHILIGKELFNSQGKFFHYTSDIIQKDKRRILHSDFSTLLYGSGIIGMGLYLILLISAGIYFSRITRHLKIDSTKLQIIKNFFWSLLFVIFFNGFSDGILGFSNRFIPFMLLGSFLGIFNNIRKNQLLNV